MWKILTLSALLSGCNACGAPQQPEPITQVGDKYLKAFLRDVSDYDVWDIVANNYTDLEGIYYSTLNSEDDSTIGLCLISAWNPWRAVYVDPVFLAANPDLERVLIYHELGHCLLDLDHSDLAGDIMYPTIPILQGYQWGDAVDAMFMRAKHQ